MKYKDFEEFLRYKFIEDEPMFTDEMYVTMFDPWLGKQEIDDVISWADEYAEIYKNKEMKNKKYNWKEMSTGNVILEKNGFVISYQPNEFMPAMPVPSFKADSRSGETAVHVRDTEIVNPYWILNGDFRKDLEGAETLEDCYKVLKENWSQVSSWSNDLKDFPVQGKKGNNE